MGEQCLMDGSPQSEGEKKWQPNPELEELNEIGWPSELPERTPKMAEHEGMDVPKDINDPNMSRTFVNPYLKKFITAEHEKWEESLIVEVMDDYLHDARNLSRLDVKPMQEHVEKLKDFIRTLITQAKQDGAANARSHYYERVTREARTQMAEEILEQIRQREIQSHDLEFNEETFNHGYNQGLSDIRNLLAPYLKDHGTKEETSN